MANILRISEVHEFTKRLMMHNKIVQTQRFKILNDVNFGILRLIRILPHMNTSLGKNPLNFVKQKGETILI